MTLDYTQPAAVRLLRLRVEPKLTADEATAILLALDPTTARDADRVVLSNAITQLVSASAIYESQRRHLEEATKYEAEAEARKQALLEDDEPVSGNPRCEASIVPRGGYRSEQCSHNAKVRRIFRGEPILLCTQHRTTKYGVSKYVRKPR